MLLSTVNVKDATVFFENAVELFCSAAGFVFDAMFSNVFKTKDTTQKKNAKMQNA